MLVGICGLIGLEYCVDLKMPGAGSGLGPICVGVGIDRLTPNRLLIVFTYPFPSTDCAAVLPARSMVAAVSAAAVLLGWTISFFVSIGFHSTSPALAGAATATAVAATHRYLSILTLLPCATPPACGPEPPP